MKYWIFPLALGLCTSFGTPQTFHDCNHSHQKMMDHGDLHKAAVLTSMDANYVEPYTVNAGYLAVKSMETEGFSGSYLTKLEKAFEVLEKVVNSEEFKNRVVNFVNDNGDRSFASNKGLTNEEIYAHFMEGREDLQQETPGEMNFYLRLYNNVFSRVIGYTNPSINTININKKYFKNFDPNEVAGNLAHEWVHKIGFGHASAKEHDSAPYAIGYIVRELGERYLKGEELH